MTTKMQSRLKPMQYIISKTDRGTFLRIGSLEDPGKKYHNKSVEFWLCNQEIRIRYGRKTNWSLLSWRGIGKGKISCSQIYGANCLDVTMYQTELEHIFYMIGATKERARLTLEIMARKEDISTMRLVELNSCSSNN
ncbi:MAG: hypothetical protein IPO78_17245 [Saprospiraceae bacterium]|nr:hypothetical protein [Saprospiraceae bacterium]